MANSFKPQGQIAGPLIIFSFVALLLGAVSELVGSLDLLNDGLREFWTGRGIEVHAEMGLPGLVGILVTAFSVFGLIAAILHTPGNSRRVILGVTAILVTVMLVPTFIVWGVFWKPFGVLLSVFWAWLSAFVYTKSRKMPCDFDENETATNVISMQKKVTDESKNFRSDGKS